MAESGRHPRTLAGRLRQGRGSLPGSLAASSARPERSDHYRVVGGAPNPGVIPAGGGCCCCCCCAGGAMDGLIVVPPDGGLVAGGLLAGGGLLPLLPALRPLRASAGRHAKPVSANTEPTMKDRLIPHLQAAVTASTRSADSGKLPYLLRLRRMGRCPRITEQCYVDRVCCRGAGITHVRSHPPSGTR